MNSLPPTSFLRDAQRESQLETFTESERKTF